MPDVPQDPRQLARDILSGKISIEDLAREQQRRRAAAGNAGPLPVPIKPVPPARAPITRPVPPPQRPIARQPAFPQQRPLQRPAQRPQQFSPPPTNQQPTQPRTNRPSAPATSRPSALQPQNRGPVFDRRPTPPLTQPTAAPAPAQAQARARQVTNENAYAAPTSIQDARSPIYNTRLNIRELVRHRTALRQCILMSEILGKPLALRDAETS